MPTPKQTRLIELARELLRDSRQSSRHASKVLNRLLEPTAAEPDEPDEPPVRPPVEPDEPTRPPRPPVDPPPVEPDEPPDRAEPGRLDFLRDRDYGEPVPPKAGYSADTINFSDEGKVIEKQAIMGSGRTAIHTPHGADHIRDVVLRDLDLSSADETKWLVRAFGANNWLIERVWFHDSNHKNEGHGLYLNVTGPLTIRDCLFENLGANAIQIVFNHGKREDDGDGPGADEGPHTEGGPILIEGCEIRNVGWNPARGSFCIAVYGGHDERHDVTLRGCVLDLEWAETQQRGGRTVQSAGGINARGYSGDSWDIGTLTIEDCDIRMTDPYQPLLQIGSCRNLVVRNNRLNGGKCLIDPDWEKHKQAGTTVWEGNTGDAVYRIQNAPFRPMSADYLDD